MKKRNKLMQMYLAAIILMVAATMEIMINQASALGISTESLGDLPDGVKIGWKASTERTVIGYEIEKYGWVGAPFSKVKPVYDTWKCCRYTGEKIDACSAPKNCSDD